MDLPGTVYLYTLATLMVTFAGFSALLLMIRQAAGAQLSPLDRFLTRTVVGNLFVLTGGALLPPLLQLCGLSEAWVYGVPARSFSGFHIWQFSSPSRIGGSRRRVMPRHLSYEPLSSGWAPHASRR